jgi:hypothetical protein
MKTGRRIVTAVILLDGAAFLAFFAIAAFRLSADRVIPLFATRWEMAEAVLDLIAWLPAIQFLALALALGSAPGKPEDLLQQSILPTVILSAILAAGALLLAPGFETSRWTCESSSARFNRALAETRADLDAGETAEARMAYGTLTAIDRLDPRVVAVEERLVGAELKAARAAGSAPKKAQPIRDPAAAKRNYAEAQDYFRQKDFYNAHWLAQRAFELDPSLTDARRLGDQAWGEILASGAGAADAARAAFFARKLDAFGRLRAGDSIEAYRLFAQMAKEAPLDADVKRYLGESLAAIEKDAFFKDEADTAARGRIFPRFQLVLPESKGKIAAVFAAESAFTPSAAYFFDLEYLLTDSDGDETMHVMTPYAKLMGGRLYLMSVERDNPAITYRPALAGPGAAPLSADTGLDLLSAYRLAAGLRLPESAGTLDLFRAAADAPAYGVSAVLMIEELLRRLGLPFALFGAAILGALTGIRFRPMAGKPSAAGWVSLPVMAAATALYYRILLSMDALLSGWSIRVTQGPMALAVSAGIRTAVLVVLVLVAAGIKERPRRAS